MGYAHYWRNVKRGPFPREFLRATRAVIAQTYYLKLTDVRVTQRSVFFNGTHETFVFEPGEEFGFCKTAAKPYDVVVVAVLALAAHYGLAEVSSDGEPSDWAAGIALARSASGIADVDVPDGVARPDVVDFGEEG